MKTENTFILHPDTKEQERALKAFVRALKIKFEITKNTGNDPQMVEKVIQGKKEIEKGKGVTLTEEELDDIRLYDEAKKEDDGNYIPLEEYLQRRNAQ